MIACKGTGKQHAKWSPVATCIMHKQPIVKFDKQETVNRLLSVEERKEFVDLCPRKVFGYNEMK